MSDSKKRGWTISLTGGEFIRGEIIRSANGDLRVVAVDDENGHVECERIETIPDSEYRAAVIDDCAARADFVERNAFRTYAAGLLAGFAVSRSADKMHGQLHMVAVLAAEMCVLEDDAFDDEEIDVEEAEATPIGPQALVTDYPKA